jgi:chemotaxis response regulator CheB
MAKAAPAIENKKSKPYPIVARGASAGDLEAVSAFPENLPDNTGFMCST